MPRWRLTAVLVLASWLACGLAVGIPVRLLLDFVGLAVDAAELDDIGVAEVCEYLRGLLAAIAALAIHEDELVFVQKDIPGFGGDAILRQKYGVGDVALVIFGLRASLFLMSFASQSLFVSCLQPRRAAACMVRGLRPVS